MVTIPLFIGGIGGPELIVVFLLVILLFGADKLPKLARASGEAMGEYQKGREKLEAEITGVKEETRRAVVGDEMDDEPQAASTATAEEPAGVVDESTEPAAEAVESEDTESELETETDRASD
ncbi:twin-arginine translocase TatA/TatE family subunit [Haloarchaeobius amylolyticus]|uniref:twin-arginine translocase TatA/TatE family subunit n=1 Tax=Haloarchaeobius amylolyticus TaxID=1198296 RepID=UPI0026E5069F|nr:twin-arginine translocase TatA/TatE family subunit [Haloarchaeobius amylolyticus]